MIAVRAFPGANGQTVSQIACSFRAGGLARRQVSAERVENKAMGWVIASVIILAVVALGVALLYRTRRASARNVPHQRLAHLFTPAERSFLRVLDQVVGDDARIFGKVRVADVLLPGKGVEGRERNEAYHSIACRSFDFLLCDRGDLSVICAVVLDTDTRRAKGRSQQAALLNEVCHAAGIPLIRVPAGIAPVRDEVRKLLAPYLRPRPRD